MARPLVLDFAVNSFALNDSDYLTCVSVQMITKNFEDYPDHRLKFFSLLRAINSHCFRALFSLSNQVSAHCYKWGPKPNGCRSLLPPASKS